MLSHLSAAALWGIRGSPRGLIDVSAPGRGRRGGAGVRLHRPRSLHFDECTQRDRIPVSTLSRTLLDISSVLSYSQLARAVEEADRLGLLELRVAEETCRRHPHRPGVVKLRRVLGALVAVPSTRSPLEQSFLHMCREEHLPEPIVNAAVAGFEVDALWPAHRLIVELDSAEFHGTRTAFETDRMRDATLQSLGYRVVRLTWRRLKHDRTVAFGQLRRMLAVRDS